MNLKEMLHSEDIKVNKVLWYGYTINLKEYFNETGLIKNQVLLEKGNKYKVGDYYVILSGIDKFKSLYRGVYQIIKQIDNNEPNPDNRKYNCFIWERVNMNIDKYCNRLVLENKNGWTWYTVHPECFEIYEIMPPYNNRTVERFRNYNEVELSFRDLKEVMDNNYKDYYDSLSCVKGIYMIIDLETGMQYVGSASGDDGIYGRWKNYAETYDGGNKEFINLHKQFGEEYFYNFKFIILHICPSNVSKKEIIELEQKYKKRFNTILLGYNDN